MKYGFKRNFSKEEHFYKFRIKFFRFDSCLKCKERGEYKKSLFITIQLKINGLV